MAEVRNIPILIHRAENDGNGNLGGSPLLAHIDPERFKLLCANLLMNAIHHSPADAVIRVQNSKDSAPLPKSRSATRAIPILPTCHASSNVSSSSDPSRSRNTGGTGLGLAICKAIN